jgi:hypothetical protein
MRVYSFHRLDMYEIADLRLIFHAEVCTYVIAYLHTTPHIPCS